MRPSLLISWMSRLFSLLINSNKRGLWSFENMRFLLDDGIHSLAYGHTDKTQMVQSIWAGPVPFPMSFYEATPKGLHPTHPVDPNMMDSRAPKVLELAVEK